MFFLLLIFTFTFVTLTVHGKHAFHAYVFKSSHIFVTKDSMKMSKCVPIMDPNLLIFFFHGKVDQDQKNARKNFCATSNIKYDSLYPWLRCFL